MTGVLAGTGSATDLNVDVSTFVRSVLGNQPIANSLTRISTADVFSADCADQLANTAGDIRLPQADKLLDYGYYCRVGQLFNIVASIVTHSTKTDLFDSIVTGCI